VHMQQSRRAGSAKVSSSAGIVREKNLFLQNAESREEKQVQKLRGRCEKPKKEKKRRVW